MPSKQTAGGKTVEEYLRKFPKAGSRTLAHKAYKEHPSLWPNWAACYNCFRYYRGAAGGKSRAKIATKEHFQKDQDKCIGFANLPEGLTTAKAWEPVEINISGDWLIISDVHIPHHDKKALLAVYQLAKTRNIKGVLLNGDISDNHAISRWQTDPRQRDFWNEICTLQAFFKSLRVTFPKAHLVWKWGNHEERFDNYMQLKAPELLNIPEFQYANISHAEEYGIQVVNDCLPVKLGKLWTLHGHEWRGGYNSPVNPARGLYNKVMESCIAGHLHQTSSNTLVRPLSDHLVTTWSTGCLCELHPKYSRIGKWNHGAAIAEVSNDGAYAVSNYRIRHGKCWS